MFIINAIITFSALRIELPEDSSLGNALVRNTTNTNTAVRHARKCKATDTEQSDGSNMDRESKEDKANKPPPPKRPRLSEPKVCMFLMLLIVPTAMSMNSFPSEMLYIEATYKVTAKLDLLPIKEAAESILRTIDLVKNDKAFTIDMDTENKKQIKHQAPRLDLFTMDVNRIKRNTNHKPSLTYLENRAHHILECIKKLRTNPKNWTEERSKRAINILGDVLNVVTGVPNHRQFQEAVNLIKNLENEASKHEAEMEKLHSSINVVTGILDAQNMNIKSIRDNSAALFRSTQKIEKNFAALANSVEFAFDVMNVLDVLQNKISTAREILTQGKVHMISPLAFDHHDLAKIVFDISANHKTLVPIYSSEQIDNYYQVPIAKSGWSDDYTIVILAHIPLVNFAEKRTMKLITREDKIAADVDISNFAFRAFSNDRREFSYLTYSDFKKCMIIEKTKKVACHKRKISIFTENINTTVAYDLTLNTMIYASRNTLNVKAECKDRKEDVTLNPNDNFLLPNFCAIYSESLNIYKQKEFGNEENKDVKSIPNLHHQLYIPPELHAKNLAINLTKNAKDIKELSRKNRKEAEQLHTNTEQIAKHATIIISGSTSLLGLGILACIIAACVMYKFRKSMQQIKGNKQRAEK